MRIVITRAGKPVARLVPWRPRRAARVLGLFRGHIRIAGDFDETLDDNQVVFE